MMRIYIAASWKNQHSVEMLTALLREKGHKVLSFVENNYGEGHSARKPMDFEKWIQTPQADSSFDYDSHGAMGCDLLIYISPSGKDAAAEVGMCYGQRCTGKVIPILGLYAKGEDFGLMRKMFDGWYERYLDLLAAVDEVEKMRKEPAKPELKQSLTTEEFRQVKDMICEATLHHDEDIKQHFLIEIGGILSGSKQQFLDSAAAQGYTIKKGRKP